MKRKAYLLCPVAETHPLYRDWINDSPVPVSVVSDFNTHWTPPEDAGVVVTHVHYRWEEIGILRRIKSVDRVPILVLADGILEYRNTFEHPELADGAVFQPIIGHKLACIGRSQARILESWGNVGKCEVVGLPRLDHVPKQNRTRSTTEKEFRLLVATARTPYFDQQQQQAVMAALTGVRKWAETNPVVDDRSLKIVWRMAPHVRDALQWEDGQADKQPLTEALQDADALITTPSTLFLEAALQHIPVAWLDFGGAPQFVPAAWTISHVDQISHIAGELSRPPASKMLFQETVLHDALECMTPAKPRMHSLIWAMAQATEDSQRANKTVALPSRILADPQRGFQPVGVYSELSELFANNPAFQQTDIIELQAELSQATNRLSHYPDAYLKQKKEIRDLHRFANWLRTRIRNRNDRIQSLVEQVERLKSELGNDGRRKKDPGNK